MKTSHLFFSAVILLLSATYSGCKKDDHNPSRTLYGTAVELGNDSIRSFVTLNGNGQPQTVGLQFGENALNDLPADTMPGMPDYEYKIPLPSQANINGINHIEVDWNPFGHEPYEIYGVPHFDFHFYYITEEEQAAVLPGPDTLPVAPQFIPKDYISGVVAVPNMGVHWFDTTASEFHHVPFTATFIYGFYHGSFTFVEPMMTKAFLETQPDYSSAIKQPGAFQQSGYYPTMLQAKYDASRHQYTVMLSGLTKH